MTTVDIPVSTDTSLVSSTPITNYVTQDTLWIGETNAGSAIYRSCIKPDFSGIAAGQVFSSAILKITPINDFSSNSRTLYVHRILRAINYSQATWSQYLTGSGWGTAGCSNSTNDYDGGVVLGSIAVSAAPTLNTAIEITLDHAEFQKLYDGTYTNNGLVLFVDTQVNDMIYYASLENATSAYRPVITIEYSAGAYTFVPKAIWF